MQKSIFALIFILTILAMITIHNNYLILLTLLSLWSLPAKLYKSSDLPFFVIAFLSFLVMDIIVVKIGVFSFAKPDFLGLPIYEPFLWGFYLVAINKLGDSKETLPRQNLKCCLIIVLFLYTYLMFSNQYHLFLSQSLIIGTAFYYWHKLSDIVYTVIGISVGAIVEYANVTVGNWFYPGGGVPIWFLTFWAAVGLLDNRLLRVNFNQNALRKGIKI